ncbi:hypothetical protein H0N98_00435 [Candidatus Micrarchaeota archaeon]|nr:hypothetical protein [Candidatus Micrarchaeota archaeon]
MARRCPMMFVAEKGVGAFGSSIDECIGEKCMWFIDNSCAVFIIARGRGRIPR